VVRRCVWSRNIKNGETMNRLGSQSHRKKSAPLTPLEPSYGLSENSNSSCSQCAWRICVL